MKGSNESPQGIQSEGSSKDSFESEDTVKQPGLYEGNETTDDSDDKSSTVVASDKKHKHLGVVILAGVVVVALVSTAGYFYSRSASAKADCEKSANVYSMSSKDLKSYLGSREVKDAEGIQASQVKDAGSVSQFAVVKKASTMVSNTAPYLETCKITWNASTKASDSYVSATKRVDDALAGIKAASKTVITSREAKSLDNLNSAIKDGIDLIKSSNGKVADNATREDLQKSVDAGNAFIKKTSGVVYEGYDNATKGIRASIDKVNASVKKKSDDDAKAAAEAAAEQARAQAQAAAASLASARAQSSTRSRSSSGYSSGSSNSSNYGSRSFSSNSGNASSSNSSSSGSRSSSSGGSGSMSYEDMLKLAGGSGGGAIACEVVGTCK